MTQASRHKSTTQFTAGKSRTKKNKHKQRQLCPAITLTQSLTQGQAGATWLANGAMSKSFSITLLINHFKWQVSAEVVTCTG